MGDELVVTQAALAPAGDADRQLLGAYVAGLSSEVSRRNAASGLDRVADLLGAGSAADVPWSRVGPAEAAAIHAALVSSDLSTASANTYRAWVRGVLRAAWRLGHLDADAYMRVVELLGSVRSRSREYRALTGGELAALFDVVRTPAEGACLALLACGLRRSEVVGLDASDLDREVGQVVVRGKGGVTRRVALRNGAAAWVDLHVGDRAGGPLFPSASGRPRPAQWVYRVVKRLGRDAGVRDVSPHRLRATCATMLMQRGVPMPVVSDVLGHANIQTTERYMTVRDEDAWAAMDQLHVPGPGDRFTVEVGDGS